MKLDSHPVLVGILVFILLVTSSFGQRYYSKKRMLELREEVRGMFQHAYEGYLRYAADYDELRPLTCDGVDTWGSYSLTLIDALDTLATMGNFTEFRRVADLLEAKMNFDKNINVSVFETNIRIVGGLLSAHLMARRAGLIEEGWPCQGKLLRLAENVARRLLPAFDTATGMPYGTVNLRYGVPKGETAVTCTAGVGTFLVEFGTLSRLTGNPIYEEVALNAIHALWARRSPIGLFGNHIDVQTGRWTALDSGIGAGVDSFFEYLVKAAILLNRPDLLEMFHEARHTIDKYLRHDDWYVWVGMNKGQVTLPVFQSLEAFWPGMLALIGDTGPAIRTLVRYGSVWRKYGFLPEFYNIPAGEASPNRESYPLRPELVESLMYLYRSTKNQYMLEIGESMLQSIEFSAKTKCGYATIRNVVTHEKENRMESFFLAETTKYLYLLFDEDNFLHNDVGEILQTSYGECVVQAGPHIFNTEAHPMDASALYCCHDLQEDIFADLDLNNYRDDVLFREERAQREELEKAKQSKYQCTADAIHSIHKKAAPPVDGKRTGGTTQQDSNLAVDIEVFDEENNPAGELLIESFERIKDEHTDGREADTTLRNQLTVSDLDEFFAMPRQNFADAEQVLAYVVAFMRNYTLDANFISGLQLFDKSVGAMLGSIVEKEYSRRIRTLWELYDLQQQYAINAALVTEFGLLAFDEENGEQLQQLLNALNANTTATDDESAPLQLQMHKIKEARFEYEIALVNTTAMQEFLLKILRNGTFEKKRSYQPLLNAREIGNLTLYPLSDEAYYRLFDSARHVLELKKRMIETLDRLQALMEENSQKLAKAAANDAVTRIDDEVVVAATQKSTSQNQKQQQQQQKHEKATTSSPVNEPTLALKEGARAESEANDTIKSVWSQLVQTILRKTTLQPSEFDEQKLLLKTRQALQKYANKPMKYELFTCQSPKFIERFAYREFYP